MAMGLLRTSLILLVATSSAKSAKKSKKGKGFFSGGLRAAKKMLAKVNDITSNGEDSSIKKNLLGNGKSLIKNIANLALGDHDDSEHKPFWKSAVDLVKQSAVDVVNDLANGEHDGHGAEQLPLSAVDAVQDLVGSDTKHESAERVPLWMSAMNHFLS